MAISIDPPNQFHLLLVNITAVTVGKPKLDLGPCSKNLG